MTTQNQFEKDAKVSTTLKDDAIDSSEIKKELTDEEIASVAGGATSVSGSSPSGPGGGTNTLHGPITGTGAKV
jgi:hypothetical protein